jgi:hypothetical protein
MIESHNCVCVIAGEHHNVTLQLEAPPPKSKAGSSKNRSKKEAAAGNKSKAGANGSGTGRHARQKKTMEPDSRSGGEDSCDQDSSSCSDSEFGEPIQQAKPANSKQRRRRNAAAAAVEDVNDDGGSNFDANAENQGSKDLAAAKAVAGKSGAAKPPAKRVRKLGTVIG